MARGVNLLVSVVSKKHGWQKRQEFVSDKKSHGCMVEVEVAGEIDNGCFDNLPQSLH